MTYNYRKKYSFTEAMISMAITNIEWLWRLFSHFVESMELLLPEMIPKSLSMPFK